MKVVIGNLWDKGMDCELILVTSNAILQNTGALVMGAGVAGQAKKLFPALPFFIGHKLKEMEERPYGIITGFIPLRHSPEFGVFQTKNHWRDDSSLDIIQYSTDKLMELTSHYESIAVNFPGIGLGNLKYEDVLDVIKPLPDNVLFFRYE